METLAANSIVSQAAINQRWLTSSWRSFPGCIAHLIRAKDLADRATPIRSTSTIRPRRRGFARAHFSREFRRHFGESPHAYLLTRRLERAAALSARPTGASRKSASTSASRAWVPFTTSFTRTFGVSPTRYRANFPPAAAHAVVPGASCAAYGRPANSTNGEDSGRAAS